MFSNRGTGRQEARWAGGATCREDVTMTDLASGKVTLDWVVARLNIERFQRKLSEETDEKNGELSFN